MSLSKEELDQLEMLEKGESVEQESVGQKAEAPVSRAPALETFIDAA